MPERGASTDGGSRGRWRVEHRDGECVEVLANRIVPLAPLVADLLAHGATGELVVVDEERGDCEMIRWYLTHPGGPGAEAVSELR